MQLDDRLMILFGAGAILAVILNRFIPAHEKSKFWHVQIQDEHLSSAPGNS